MKKGALVWLVIIIIAIGGTVWLANLPAKPGKLDSFASCIKDSGATFYGAFWCPHCANQKAIFGSSAKLLPYVECSTPDGKNQLQICDDAEITTYPTWEFITGISTTRENGEVSLERLSELTNCPLSTETGSPEDNG